MLLSTPDPEFWTAHHKHYYLTVYYMKPGVCMHSLRKSISPTYLQLHLTVVCRIKLVTPQSGMIAEVI